MKIIENKEDRRFYVFGKFRLDTIERVLYRDGEPVKLPPKVIDTLIALVCENNRIVERDVLMSAVWGDTFVEEGNLSVNVSTLRKTLGTDDSGRQYIETVARRGYRFRADVKEFGTSDAVIERKITARIRQTVDDGDDMPPPVALMPAARLPIWKHPVFFASAALALLIAGGLFIAAKYYLMAPAESISQIRTLAILPFRELNPTEEKYLGLGLTDSLITRLGNVESFTVRPTSAVMKFEGTDIDAVSVGRQLGVEAVMEGTIKRSGSSVRLNIQIVRVGDGTALWSEQFDAESANLLSLEDSITNQVARRFAKELSGENKRALDKQFTTSAEAHRLYVEGKYFRNQRTAESMRKAVELFERSIKIDNNYALAHAALAYCYVIMGDLTNPFMPPTEAYPKARIVAGQALMLDDSVVEAHVAIAAVEMMYDWDLSAAERSLKKALEINPNESIALKWYGWYYIATRQFDRAEEMMRRGFEQDPVGANAAVDFGYPAFFAGDYETALARFNSALELDGDHPVTLFVIWRAHQQRKDYSKASAQVDTIERLFGRSSLSATLRAVTLAASGDVAGGEKIYADLIQDRAQGKYVSPLLLAALAAEINRQDEAFRHLEQAITERNDVIYLRVAPEFRRLQADPRFADLLRRTGLDP